MSKYDDSNDDNNSADYSGNTCAPVIGLQRVLAECGPGGNRQRTATHEQIVSAVANRYLTSTHAAMASAPLQANQLWEAEARNTAP